MGRSYKLYAGAVNTAAAAASFRVTKKCNIRCIQLAHMGQAGAATDGYFGYEISKQNTSSLTINDTPDTVIATFGGAAPVSGGAYQANGSVICAIPADVGDTIYLNFFRGGTAPVASVINITIYTD